MSAGRLQAPSTSHCHQQRGCLLSLVRIVLIYGRTGALTMGAIGLHRAATRPTGCHVAFLLISRALLSRARSSPFHSLAYAHAWRPTLGVRGCCPGSLWNSPVRDRPGLLGAVSAPGARAPAAISHVSGACVLRRDRGPVLAPWRHIQRMRAFHHHMRACSWCFALHRSPGGRRVYVAGHGLVKGACFGASGSPCHRLGSGHETWLHGRGRPCAPPGGVHPVRPRAAEPPTVRHLPGQGLHRRERLATGCPGFTGVFAAFAILTVGAVFGSRAACSYGLFDSPSEDHRDGRDCLPRDQSNPNRAGSEPATMIIPRPWLVAAAAAIALIPHRVLGSCGATRSRPGRVHRHRASGKAQLVPPGCHRGRREPAAVTPPTADRCRSANRPLVRPSSPSLWRRLRCCAASMKREGGRGGTLHRP